MWGTNFYNIWGFGAYGGKLFLVVLAIWELAWKGMGLWKASQQKQKEWFIVMLLLNTAGILPIVYLNWFSKDKKKKKK